MPVQNDARRSPPYGIFARVYDQVMADIDYEEWTEFILTEVVARGWEGGRILDLGCGTGNSAAPLLQRGFEVSGLDGSEAMLQVARQKFPHAVWYHGDFTSFELPQRFSLVQSVFDSLNNLRSLDGFLETARRVHAHLEPGGFFMFDVNTSFGLTELWEGGSLQGWLGTDWYGWTHSWDPATKIATVEAGFLLDGVSWLEVHQELALDQDDLRRLLVQAGFEDIEMLEEPWGDVAAADAPRVWVLARRPG